MRASSTLSSTGEPAYAVNRVGVVTAWNPAAEKTFGYSESDALGRYCWELLAGQDLFGNKYCCQGCPLREMAFQRRTIRSNELYFRTAENQYRRFRVSRLVMYDGPGKELLVHLCRPQSEDDGNCAFSEQLLRSTTNHHRGALTRREREVLTLLAEGLGTKEVAAQMCISPTTVRNHIQHVLLKLHVHSRLEAVAVGRKLRLISRLATRSE